MGNLPIEGEDRVGNVVLHSIQLMILREISLLTPLLESLLEGGGTSSFVPTPHYDPRYNFPFFDQSQIPTLNPATSFPSTHVGDTSLLSTPNPVFFQTFGPYMPYNPNLILSLKGIMQQPQSTQ